MKCAFTSLVRTECGMFVMYCMQCVCPCQMFCSAWMCRLEEVYKCLQLWFSSSYVSVSITSAVLFCSAFGKHSHLHCLPLPSSGMSLNLILCSRKALISFLVVTDLILYTGIDLPTFLCTI